MKKSFLFTSLVAALLVGVLFFINKTNAQTAQLTLSVTAGTISSCTMATGINLGTIVASSSVGTISGSTRVGPSFGCTDLKGDTGRNYTMSASALAGTPAGNIANTNITLTPSGNITVSVGSCPSVTTGAGGTLNTAKNLITKANGYGQTCTFSLPSAQAKITVSVPAWTPVGTYTSTLTVVYPS